MDKFPMLFNCSTHWEATIDFVLLRRESGGFLSEILPLCMVLMAGRLMLLWNFSNS
jgi:hypothetical protein